MATQPIDPPPELAKRLAALYGAVDVDFRKHRWNAAYAKLAGAYGLLSNAQPPHQRYHKGYPLHNMGIARLLARNTASPDANLSFWEDSRRYTLLAFIEDALSDPDPQGSRLGTPAVMNLNGVFRIADGPLDQVALEARAIARESPHALRQPEFIFEHLTLSNRFPGETSPVSPSKRYPGQFGSPWTRRVFVGGNYRTHIAQLNSISELCRALDFDPVMPIDFEIEERHIHHHSLMLLHECRLAIFEVTVESGQLMELERTRDYGIVPLVISQHGTSSEMIASGLRRLGLASQVYSSNGLMEKLVSDYLQRSEPDDSGR